MCLSANPQPYQRMLHEDELLEVARRAFEEGFSYALSELEIKSMWEVDEFFEKSQILKTIKSLIKMGE